MNGNNPYAGAPGVVEAGQPTADADVAPEDVRTLRRAVAGIVTRTRTYLPDSYAVGSELSTGSDGPEATVAVRPPAGHAVSAGLSPDPENPDTGIAAEDREEVARGLAAGAALQVMNAVGVEDVTPTAK